MSTINSLFVALLCTFLLVLSSCHVSSAGRPIPSSAPSTVVRPLATEDDQDYSSLRPLLNHNGQPILGHGREFKGCLPKGFKRASAPSRFVNYHTLGSAGCNNSKGVRAKKP